MRKPQFEAVLKATAEFSGIREFIVVGSQSLHAHTEKVPVEVLISKECDLWAKGKFEKLTAVEEALGQRSPYFTEHGVYVDAVEPGLVLLPSGWEQRLKPLRLGEVTAWCLDVHDLVVSKLNAGRIKDYEFINAVLRLKLTDAVEVAKRIQTFRDPHQQAVLLARLQISSEGLP
jgi:hypothetical protein